MLVCQRDTGANLESAQWLNVEQFEQEIKVVLNYNPKCKINIRESILI